MNLKVEKQENSKVVLEFTMDKKDFEKELDKAFNKNAKHFKVPGFRNGKVPKHVVEKMYGEGVLYEAVIENCVDAEYKKAVEENNLEVVSKPELDVKQIGKDKDLIFTVSLYVKPEATVTKYKELEIEKVDTKIKKEEIDLAIEKDREKNARIVSIEDRPLKEKDISTIDFEGFVDGVAFEGGKGENFELTIGSGQFIPGFEEQLVGMNIGEEREIKVKFPEEYHSNELAGKDSIFKVKLISIKEKVLPELDNEFAKDVSEFETLEEYKKSVEEKVKHEKEHQAEHEREHKATDKLVENTEVVIPDSMIEDETDRMLEQMAQNLAYQGMSIDMYYQYMGTTKEDFKKSLVPDATRDVKLKLALEYIIKAENLKAEDSEIDAKIDELYANYGNDSTTNFKDNQNVRKYITDSILQQKALDVVINSVVEK